MILSEKVALCSPNDFVNLIPGFLVIRYPRPDCTLRTTQKQCVRDPLHLLLPQYEHLFVFLTEIERLFSFLTEVEHVFDFFDKSGRLPMLLNCPRGRWCNIFPKGLPWCEEVQTKVPRSHLCDHRFIVTYQRSPTNIYADSSRRSTIWIRLHSILDHADMKRDW